MAEKPKKKSGRQNYDWNSIMIDYCSDPKATLKSISEKYDIRMDTVAKKSKADDWFATRKKYQKKLVKKALTKAGNKQAHDLAVEMELLAKMQAHVSRAVDDSAQFNRHIKVDPVTGDLTEVVTDKVDARAVKDIMQTLKMIEDMSRSLYNIQKAEAIQKRQMEAERLAIEKERLALERERLAFRNQQMGNENDGRYGVVLIPEVTEDGE